MDAVTKLEWLGLRLRAKLTPGRSPNGQTGDCDFAHGRHPVNHLSLLNHMARLYGYRSYLEIGVRDSAGNLDRVEIEDRTGVDPNPASGATHVMTSDAYFASHCERSFDLIFIDGAHTGEVVYRDIVNALNHLSEGGTIMLHDLNPPTRYHARPSRAADEAEPAWNGTSWEGYARLRQERDDLEMCVVDTDFGCGVVRRGRQTPYAGQVRGYDDLARDRKAILNLISVEAFLSRHPAPAAAPAAVA